MFFLYFLIIVSFLDIFVQLPIISPYALELGASSFLTGLIIAVNSLTNMIGNGAGGYWADRFGRKKILAIGFLSTIGTLLLYPLANSGETLFLVRFIHGFTSGLIVPALLAYASDVAAKQKKTSGLSMAYTGACIGTSAIIGPAIGGAVSSALSVKYVFYIVAILFFIALLIIFFVLKEVYNKSESENVDVGNFKVLIRKPFIVQASLSALILMSSIGILTYALPLKVEELAYNSAITGGLISTFGIVALIFFLTPINVIYDAKKPQHLIMTGLVCVIISLFALNMVNSIFLILLFMVFYGAGFALIFPSMNRLIVDATNVDERGKAFGILFSAFSVGMIIGSTITGIVEEFQLQAFLSGSIIILLFTLILFALMKRHSVPIKTNVSD